MVSFQERVIVARVVFQNITPGNESSLALNFFLLFKIFYPQLETTMIQHLVLPLLQKNPKKTEEKLWPQYAFQTVWVCVPIYRSSHNTSLGWNLEQLVKTFIDDSRQKYFLIYNLYLQLCRLYFYATKVHLYHCHKYLEVSERMCCEYKITLSLHFQICPRS